MMAPVSPRSSPSLSAPDESEPASSRPPFAPRRVCAPVPGGRGGAGADPGFFLIDDWGWTDAACFGSKRDETPNIDWRAAQGMKFTQA